ncbi:MAG: NUDIX hydrolase [Acidobacteriota bacterium]
MLSTAPSRNIPPHAKKAYQGKIFSIWQWEQELYDGSAAIFESIGRSDYATVIGVLPDQTILLVWDEQPDRKPVLTTAGGRVEAGESPEEAARREFREETGYTIGTLVHLFTYQPSQKAQFSTHMFVGRQLRQKADPQLDPGERIEFRIFSFEEFLRLGQSDSADIGGPVRDWMLRIVLLEAQVDPKKKERLHRLLYE